MIDKEIKKNKVFLVTYGCQMNLRDAEITRGLLLDSGFKVKDSLSDSLDAVLLITCSVRQHAEDKVWSEIGRLAKSRPRPLIGLIGCMAENYKESAFAKAKGLDLVIGPNNIGDIPRLLKDALKAKCIADKFRQKILAVGRSKRDESVYRGSFREDKTHAYVVVSEGCNNFCSYCVVPYVRGGLRNRNHEDILNEVRFNIDKGINRITLLGQNVNAYCSDDKAFDFIHLLEAVNNLRGLKELAFVTSHPKDASARLFQAMSDLDKVKKYLHLPVQSGSNRILELMQRGYSRQHYIYLIGQYRKIVKNGYLSTDIIVGYPTEEEKDFQDSLSLVERIRFNNAYIFKYSPRVHTEAAKLADDIPREEKERRHKVLLGTQKQIALALK